MIIITLFRILVVFMVAYFLSKLLINFLSQCTSLQKRDSHPKTETDTIDMCPECGRVKEKYHRCP